MAMAIAMAIVRTAMVDTVDTVATVSTAATAGTVATMTAAGAAPAESLYIVAAVRRPSRWRRPALALQRESARMAVGVPMEVPCS